MRFLDRALAIASLKACAAGLVRQDPSVEAVVLFGSLAREDFGARSDADILVCLKASPYKRLQDRIPVLLAAFLDAVLPVDVIPLTTAELLARLEGADRFWRRALTQGVVLAGELPPSLLSFTTALPP